jgi:hypothetical protein
MILYGAVSRTIVMRMELLVVSTELHFAPGIEITECFIRDFLLDDDIVY